MGDVTGIGPEVALKAIASAVGEMEDTRFVVIGDSTVADYYAGLLGLESGLPRAADPENADARVVVHDPGSAALSPDLPPGDPAASRAAVDWLREGARMSMTGELAGIVTAPVSKEAIINAGFPKFVGQTEFLSECAGVSRTAMMLLGADDRGRWLRVALATTHVPIKDVARTLTTTGITQAIELAGEACSLLGLGRRRIAVCGLNPHAGEGGKMGTEEIEFIAPAVVECRGKGFDVHGPFPADTLFYEVFRGEYDAVVAMYHDQGLVPLKMIGFESGVNWTLGLPFVRTSPDHGTAYNIAGRGIANPSSMMAALRLARQVALARPFSRPPPGRTGSS